METLRAIDAESARVVLLADVNPTGGERSFLSTTSDRVPAQVTLEPEHSAMLAGVARGSGPMRHTRTTLEREATPGWLDRMRAERRPRNWLATPIRGRGESALGVIEVTNRARGNFTLADEVAVARLASIAAEALEVVLFRDTRTANHKQGELMSMLSHELRTPLGTMVGWTALLRSGKLSDAEFTHGLDILDRSVQAQAQLIDDMADLSRIVTGTLGFDPHAIDLRPEVTAAAAAVRPACDARSLRLELRMGALEACVSGDRMRLQQVVRLLIGNAIRSTPAGGGILVTIDVEPPVAVLRVREDGGAAPVSPPDPAPAAAVHGDERADGAGLGLALGLASQLVELHGGTLEVTGEGRGTCFTVRLPIHDAAHVRPGPRVLRRRPEAAGRNWAPAKS